MKTKYDVGDVVYIKAVVDCVSVYANNKGTIVTEYQVKTPEIMGRTNDTLYIKEEHVYSEHVNKVIDQ